MANKKIQRRSQSKKVTPSGEKIRVVIRNMEDVINFQILRWKRAFPDAAEPEEWSANEIGPNDHYVPEDDISEEDEKIILADDEANAGKRMATASVQGRGTYSKGYGAAHANPEFQALAAKSHKEHYDKELMKVLDDLQKEFGDEYEIVYEGEYAKKLMDEGTKVPDPTKKGIRANY